MIRLAVILCAALVACDLGTAAPNHGTDGGTKMDGAGKMDAPNIVPAHDHCAGNTIGQTGCTNLSNKSNAGEDCASSGCHITGGLGTVFGFMGTLYTDSSCSAVAPGVTVTFGSATAVTDAAGNFYSYSTIPSGNYTAKTSSISMSAQTTYDCNSASCHMAKAGQPMPGSGNPAYGNGNGSIYN